MCCIPWCVILTGPRTHKTLDQLKYCTHAFEVFSVVDADEVQECVCF